MPVTYTNRKGVTYTLFQVQTTAGQIRYVVGQCSKGDAVDELPPGFRFSESPNGVVSLVRVRPQLVLPEETAAVEAVVGAQGRSGAYRVATKHNTVEVYAKVGPDLVDVYHEMLANGLALPGREAGMRELDEQMARFVPVVRFVLTDAAQRWFRVDRMVTFRDLNEWVWSGQEGDVAALAQAVVPALLSETSGDLSAGLDPIAAVGWRGPIPGTDSIEGVTRRNATRPATGID